MQICNLQFGSTYEFVINRDGCNDLVGYIFAISFVNFYSKTNIKGLLKRDIGNTYIHLHS